MAHVLYTAGLSKTEEVEESKRKVEAKIEDLREQLEAANTKIATAERNRARTMGELDDAQVCRPAV